MAAEPSSAQPVDDTTAPPQAARRRLGHLFFDKRSSSQLQLDSLDGLRGLAVLLVLLSHLSNTGFHLIPGLDLSGSGKYGVYLFFVLSAFLLSLPLVDMERSEFASPHRWLAYGMRRLLRIAPLYLLVLTLHWFVSSRFSALVFGLMDADSLVEHLLLQRGDGVYWAVPVEMKYYLLLPLASFGLALVRGRALVLATIGTGALVAWLAPAASLAHNSTALLPYLPVLLAGSFAASLQREIERRGASETVRARLGFEAIAALCAIVAIVLVPSVWAALAGTDLDPNRFHGETLLWGGLWGVFVIAMLNGSGWTRAALSHPALRLIGIVSFSVYLWHMPIIRALFLLLPGMPQPVFAAVAVALVLLASAISFVLIERPFIRSRAAIRLLARLG